MGSVPITFAAAKSPEKFAGIVYIAALLSTPGKPAGFYSRLEDQRARSKIGSIIAANPTSIELCGSTRELTIPQCWQRQKKYLQLMSMTICGPRPCICSRRTRQSPYTAKWLNSRKDSECSRKLTSVECRIT